MALKVGIHAPNPQHDGGTVAAVEYGRRYGTVMQTFLGSPQRYFCSHDPDLVAVKKAVQTIDVVVHGAYVINCAGPDSRAYNMSIHGVKNHVMHCIDRGINTLVLHCGSPKELTQEESWKQMEKALREADKRMAAEGYKRPPEFRVLFENLAWKTSNYGDLATVRYLVRAADFAEWNAGICLDTAHLWAHGVDLNNSDSWEEILRYKLDINLIHLNDCPVECGSGKDRHSNTVLGTGKISHDFFKWFLEEFKDVPMILERMGSWEEDIKQIEAWGFQVEKVGR